MTSLFQEACRYIPGGVNSPVRAFRGVGGEPIFFKKASGAHAVAADGRRFIDYVGSWGPMILGHAHPQVIAAVQAVAADGLSFGAPTEIETALARRVVELMPSIELVRFVSSGTEATMSAIRLARGFTGRDTIVKFEGCYHGHSDSLLIKAGSGMLTLGVPTSPGVPAALAAHTVTLDYNDADQVRDAFGQIGDRVACVIVEPVAGNMNCVTPAPGFLQTLREVCDRSGAVLIFDEVMTGFRVALGGAQALYGVRPDLTTLGKIIGGGMPVGAFGGRRDIMERLAPLGPVYQAGTLSGNPVAMTAGLTTLELISAPGFHQRLGTATDELVARLRAAADRAGVALATNHVCGMFGFFFSSEERVDTYAKVMSSRCGAVQALLPRDVGRRAFTSRPRHSKPDSSQRRMAPATSTPRSRPRRRSSRRCAALEARRPGWFDRVRALACFLGLFLAGFGAMAAFAYPAWAWLHPHFGFPFHRVGERIGMLALALGLGLAARPLGLTNRASFGFGIPRRRFLAQMSIALVLGVVSMVLVVGLMTALGLLDLSEAESGAPPAWSRSPPRGSRAPWPWPSSRKPSCAAPCTAPSSANRGLEPPFC